MPGGEHVVCPAVTAGHVAGERGQGSISSELRTSRASLAVIFLNGLADGAGSTLCR